MSRLRFSLASLLAFTLFVAFTCAALRYATDLWASAAVSLTAALLLLGVLAAALRPAARPFWIGFALFGLAYFYVSIGPGRTETWHRLLTTHGLEYLEGKLNEPQPRQNQSFDAYINALLAHNVALANRPIRSSPPGNFQAIGHSALAILIGLLGGVAGSLIHVRGRQPIPSDERASKPRSNSSIG